MSVATAVAAAEVRATTDPGTSPPADTSEESPAEPTGTPIKIGLIYSETGRTATTYDMAGGVATAWEEWVNTEMGGVNSHPVEIVLADGKSAAEGAVTAANELIDEGVVGIVVQDSIAENAIIETVTAAGIPMIGGTANARPPDTGDAHWPNSFFVTAPSNPATASSTLIAANAAGMTNYAAAVCAEVPTCAEAGELFEVMAPDFDLEYVGLVTVGASDPSYTAPCLELINQGAEVINLALAVQTAISIIDECALQGYEGAYASTSNSVTAWDFEEIDGLHLIGSINGFPWWADAEPVQTFLDVNERYGDGADIRTSSATITWSTLELFRKAMGDNGPAADAEVSAEDVIDVYHGIDGETLDGLLPQPVSFVEEGFQPALNCFWMFDMQDGEFTTTTAGESGNGVEGDLATTCFG